LYARRSTDVTDRTKSVFAGEIGFVVGFGTGAATATIGTRTATANRRNPFMTESSGWRV